MSDDRVEPGDAALQALLVSMAQRSVDSSRHDALVDFAMTAPPLASWPTSALERLDETCSEVMALARAARDRADRERQKKNEMTARFDQSGGTLQP